MEIELQYGKKGLSVHLPELCTPTIIKKPKMPILSDHKSAIDKALTNPINSQPLAELSKKSKSACIVICDITRPVPNHLFLRPIIDIMISSGIKKENICILVKRACILYLWLCVILQLLLVLINNSLNKKSG